MRFSKLVIVHKEINGIEYMVFGIIMYNSTGNMRYIISQVEQAVI